MGCCASKKTPPSALPPLQCSSHDHERHESNTEKAEEVVLIRHRRSSDRRSEQKGSSPETGSSEPEISDPKSPASEAVARNIMAVAASGGIVRTSSCTKEEVDAILIQCGRLSRSSSGKDGVNHSGSKRSHDFDREDGGSAEVDCDERHRRRQSRGRRTPSRSRERSNGGGRRVSRSPGRRSENPVTTPASGSGGAASSTGSVASNDGSSKPGKMVAVPPTEKGSNGGGGAPAKRNAISPRSQSPARSVQPSLSRSSSRKAEHSPYRRTPLNDLDINKANNCVNTVSQSKVKAVAEAPPPLTRSRSSRRSRDLDINVELLLNPKPAAGYNSRILEDIHNFHQKTNSDANQNGAEFASTSVSKVSEYVTIRKGGGGVEARDEESSGSNNYPLGRASGEPNSAESTDRRTSRSPVSLERHAASSNRGRESLNRTQTEQVRARGGARGWGREGSFVLVVFMLSSLFGLLILDDDHTLIKANQEFKFVYC